MSICKGISPFLAHYLTHEQQFSFKEDSAEVCTFSNQTTTEFPIRPDSFNISVIPQESRLTHKKTLRWLLKNDFIPSLRGKEIVFIPSLGSPISSQTLDLPFPIHAITLLSTRILASADGMWIRLWDLSTKTCLRTLSYDGANVSSLTHFPDGTLVGAGRGRITLWNSSTGECLKKIDINPSSPLVLEPLSGKLLAMSNHSDIEIWDLSSGTCRFTLKGHTAVVKSLAKLPGELLASASEDRTIKIWDFSKGEFVRTLQAVTNGIMIAIPKRIVDLPNGILISAIDNLILVCNPAGGVHSLGSHRVKGLALLHDFGILAILSDDHTVKLLRKDECITTLEHDSPVHSLASLPGEILATVSDKTVKLWKLPLHASSEKVDGVQVLAFCDRAIGQMQAQLAEEGADDPENLVCPITRALFREPRIANCGHTFEKSAIESHLQGHQLCPLCRTSIYDLKENWTVKQLAEEARNNCPIPSPIHPLLNNDINTALNCIEAGKALAAKGDLGGALDLFKKAMRFTNRSEDYAVIPPLFEQRKDTLKASLAYLHLAKCQFHEGKLDQVDATFEKILQLNLYTKAPPGIKEAYAAFCQMRGDNVSAFSLYQELAQKPDLKRDETIYYLEHALMCDPSSIETYEKLLPFYDPERKITLYLMAFLHLFSTQPEKAKEFLEKARQSASDNPLVHLAYLSHLNKNQTQERLEIYRTLAAISEKEKALIYLRKALRSEQFGDFRRYVSALLQSKELEKAEKVYLDWSNLCTKKNHHSYGINVLNEAVEKIGEKSSFLERLFTIFTELYSQSATYENHFKDTARRLGDIYEREKKFAEAERVYRSAYEKFQEFESGCKLADMLQEQGKTEESVRIYYNLSETAFYRKEFDKILPCFERIKQFDPAYQWLTQRQKQSLFTHYYLSILFQPLSR